jgi:response regulator NasT
VEEGHGTGLRIVFASAGTDRTASSAQAVAALGHEVTVRELDDVATEGFDLVLVEVGDDPAHALELIETLVEAAACPVIPLVNSTDFVRQASRRGIFAFLTDRPGEDWASAIDIGLRRFGEYQALRQAFARRAVTERAKGILMERHAVDEATAFQMLREHARTSNRKLFDVAAAVAAAHVLLVGR